MTARRMSYLYARVSSSKQDTYSQKPELLRWRDDNDPDAVLVEDIGTGKNWDRKGIQSIIEHIKKGLVRQVVVVSVNRLGRSVTEATSFIDLCEKHKVTIVSIREGHLDLQTPFGKCMATILLSFAQLENEQRGDATRAGIAAAKELAEKEGRKFKFGGSMKGWSSKITPENARQILALHKAGESYRAIGRAVRISDKTIRDFIKNPRGEILTRKQLAEKNKKKKGKGQK